MNNDINNFLNEVDGFLENLENEKENERNEFYIAYNKYFKNRVAKTNEILNKDVDITLYDLKTLIESNYDFNSMQKTELERLFKLFEIAIDDVDNFEPETNYISKCKEDVLYELRYLLEAVDIKLFELAIIEEL